MLTRIWRGVTEGLFGRRAVFVVADDAASAEAKFLAHSKYAAPFEVSLHEEFETPVPGCEHPHARRVFWQFASENRFDPGYYTRCYFCIGCGARVHVQRVSGKTQPCTHDASLPLPPKDAVHP